VDKLFDFTKGWMYCVGMLQIIFFIALCVLFPVIAVIVAVLWLFGLVIAIGR